MNSLPETDPLKLALLYVQQWLSENGLTKTLDALEREMSTAYDDSKLTQGSKLMHLVWRDMEEAIAECEDDAVALMRKEREEEEEALLRGGRGDIARSLHYEVEASLHPSPITVGGYLRLIEIGQDPKLVWEVKASEFSGGILSIDIYMEGGGVSFLTSAGTMSGELSVFRLRSRMGSDGEGPPRVGPVELLATSKLHTKFLTRCLFAPSSDLSLQSPSVPPLLLSVGHDHYVCVSRLDEQKRGLDLLRRIPFLAAVNDIAFLGDPATHIQEGRSLIVALKDSPCLRVIDLATLLSKGTGEEDEATLMSRCERKVVLSEHGDAHVSLSVKLLCVSPDGRFLACATDSSRVLVLRVGGDWRPRSIFMTQTSDEPFHTPCLAWHYCSNYLYVSSGVGGTVEVLHLGSGKSLAHISAHKINVRNLWYDTTRRVLLTCSFDKTVKIWV